MGGHASHRRRNRRPRRPLWPGPGCGVPRRCRGQGMHLSRSRSGHRWKVRHWLGLCHARTVAARWARGVGQKWDGVCKVAAVGKVSKGLRTDD
ncbi:hypothetical protein E7T06_15100 [Deinococcus sp. Arct2-2]|nr:hypothetical protein E7T06_15100 [Deinococcus sp. Arct2-2]